jgi:GNAT superfamily N-acetyltransferase
MQIATRELSRFERETLERHLLALDDEDRRLRFGIALPDQAIRDYVARIDFGRDAAFGAFDDALQLVAAAHLARCDGHAELGVSVLPEWRGRGAGAALLARSHTHARNWGIRALFMHCLSENGAMMHLARKQGMRIVTERGESDAWLELPPADASSYTDQLLAERVGLFDFALKRQLQTVRSIAGALRFKPEAG